MTTPPPAPGAPPPGGWPPPPGGWPPPPGPPVPPTPPRRSGGRTALIVIGSLLAGLLLLVVAGVAVTLTLRSQRGVDEEVAAPAPAAPAGDPATPAAGATPVASTAPDPLATAAGWLPGSCVAPLEGTPDSFVPVGCEDGTAVAEVLQVVDFTYLREPPCPQESDFWVSDIYAGTACVRNLAPPHPGDVGGGEGLLRVGDCVDDGPVFTAETPCAGPDAAAEVTARVNSETECPPDATAWLRLDGEVALPVVCIRDLP